MLRKTIISLCVLSIVSFADLYAMHGEEEDQKNSKTVQRTSPQPTNSKNSEEKKEEQIYTYLTKNSFVTGATVVLVYWGERWFVDKATDLIEKSIKSSNSLLDWTISSAIRGKSIQEALPIAQERGKLIGIVAAGMTAPLIWDCGNASIRSCHKVIRHIFEDNVPDEQKPTKRDYLKAGLGTTIFGAIFYTIYKSFSH